MPEESLLYGVVFSIFDDEGPSPRFVWPTNMDYGWQLQISMKTISLLMGERTYQDGDKFDEVKYYGVLPFPDFGLDALSYFFLLRDENARGQAKAATITLLVQEKNRNFLYEDMTYLQSMVSNTATKICETKEEAVQISLLHGLIAEIQDRIKQKASPFAPGRMYKILFTGLDNSGKTSFLLGVQEKYSKILGSKPTRGITRSSIELFGSQLLEWELGGQQKYRDAINNRGTVLYGTDILFFLVDGRDAARLEEACTFFNSIIHFLQGNDLKLPIIVCIHKIDPDVKTLPAIRENVQKVEQKFQAIAQGLEYLKFFETSIFDHWSMLQAFSYGVSRLSPNREIAHLQLQWLADKIHAEGLYLLNETGLILSDNVKNTTTAQALEISVPHLFNAFRNFKKGNLLQKGRAIWRVEDRIIVFQEFAVQKYTLYLVAQLPQESSLALLEENWSEFLTRIAGLVQNYL